MTINLSVSLESTPLTKGLLANGLTNRQSASAAPKPLHLAQVYAIASPTSAFLPTVLWFFVIVSLAFHPCSRAFGEDSVYPPILDMTPADVGLASIGDEIAACAKLIAKSKNPAEVSHLHYMQGLLFLNSGKRKAALDEFRIANAVVPGNPDVLLMLAVHENVSTKVRKEAVENFVRTHPTHVDSLLVMSCLCEQERDVKAAVAWATRALAVEGTNLDQRSRAFHRRAEALNDLGEYPSSLADVNRSIVLKPRPSIAPDQVYNLRAQILLFMGKPAEAIASLSNGNPT